MAKLRFDPMTYQFYYRCRLEDGAPATAAGFGWDPVRRRFYTEDPMVAMALANRGDDYARHLLADALETAAAPNYPAGGDRIRRSTAASGHGSRAFAMYPSRKAWTRRVASLGLALLLAIAASAPSVAAPPANPQDNVRSFYSTLLITMKDARTLGQSGRYAKLAPVIDRLFDVPLMTRLAVGSYWAALSPMQMQQVTAAFGHYIAATYADQFDSYSGQQLQIIGEQSYGAEVIVQTRIVKSDGNPVSLDYRMHENAGSWQISDVYFNGTISQLATQRSEFNAILNREGVDGLISALDRKVDFLTRNVVQSS